MPAKHLGEVGPETFLVVPAYNEARVIGGVVSSLLTTFPNVVVVNDGSSDDTAAILKELPVTVVNHYVNLGQGAALQTGIKHALERGARYIVTFDADGQHRVEDALAAVHMLREGGCDVVCGSRFLGTTSNVPRTRKIILKAAVRLANLTTGGPHDRCPQWLACAEPQGGCVPRPVAVGDGTCVRNHQPAEAAQDADTRGAGSDRLHRVLAGQGPVFLELNQHPP
jgi:hypothetical protein